MPACAHSAHAGPELGQKGSFSNLNESGNNPRIGVYIVNKPHIVVLRRAIV